jgi:hypothetical protein
VCASIAKIYGKNKYIHEIVKKKKIVLVLLSYLTLQVMAVVHGKCLIKIKRH